MAAPDGSRLGGALSDAFATTYRKAKEATAGLDHAVKDRFTAAFMERMESDMAPSMQAMFGWILEQDDTPDELRALVTEATAPGHQFGVIFQLELVLSFALTAFFRVGEPLVQALLNKAWAQNQNLPLSPSEVALAVLRGNTDFANAQAEAALTGINANRLQLLVDNTGEPPGPEELLALRRRGMLDDARLTRGIRQSRVRDEWIDLYVNRHFDPLAPAEAVEATVQGQLDYPAAQALAGQSGVSPGDFDILYRTRGNPPGAQEIGEAFHRGLLTHDQAIQAIIESRYKNKYAQVLLDMSTRFPPERSVVMLVAHEAIDFATGVAWLLRLGFDQTAANALITEGMNRKHAKSRDVTVAEILTLYTSHAVDHATASAYLHQLGYDDTETAWELAVADSQRVRRFTEAAISRVHSVYVGHHLDRPAASAALDGLQVPAPQRDDLLHLWDLERASVVKNLTEAEVERAFKQGWIDEAEMTDRLTRLGYDTRAVAVLVALNGGTPLPGSPRAQEGP